MILCILFITMKVESKKKASNKKEAILKKSMIKIKRFNK